METAVLPDIGKSDYLAKEDVPWFGLDSRKTLDD
jgi:hypothetical protein